MPNLELKGYSIDDVTKGLGAIAIGAYVIGYIVLSYYLSTFGFNPLSPFRARVLETGICALVLFAIPMGIAMAVASISRRDMSFSFVLAMRLLCLPIFCEMMCAVPGFVDELPKTIPLHKLSKNQFLAVAIICLIPIVAAALVWILSVVVRWIWHNYHKKKTLVVITLWLMSTISVYLGIGSVNTIMHRHIFLWFLGVSIIACVLTGSSREKAQQKKIDEKIAEAEQLDHDLNAVLAQLSGLDELPNRKTDRIELETKEMKKRLTDVLAEIRSHTSFVRLEIFIEIFGLLMLLGYSVCAIAAYTNWVFPFIPLKLGGGEIVAVTLYQTDANQSPHPIHGGVLDQSDQGFYVLPSGYDKGLFVPKEQIEAIYFGNGPSDLNSVTK